jgi:pyruvate formate-lyase/glycerol dehydratase family glycyl radical enzyme
MTHVTFGDLTLADVELTSRVRELRDAYFKAMPEICIERPQRLTAYHSEHGLFDKPRIGVLDKARAYRDVLEHRKPIVRHDTAFRDADTVFHFSDRSLFMGSTTSKFKGVPIYPEFMALALWPELHSISRRARNPYRISDAEIEVLNRGVFPSWMERSILEVARARRGMPPLGAKEPAPNFSLLEQLVFFLASKPNCISHTVPDFSRAVNEGLRAVIDDAAARRRAASGAAQDFYQATVEVLEGIIAYSKRLAATAKALAEKASDPSEERELEELAEVYEHVPEHRARTFREALTTVWVCWIAVHLENANVGLSLGRLDQLLYPFYKADVEAHRLTVAGAVELVCCLWLKIGDHVPTIPDSGEQLFGGTGSNQAITIGGVDAEGNDAVNDLTYVMLRATELMMLRDPNLNARYHPVNGEAYLRRLCDANVKTKATPAIHNDRAVFRALAERGDTPAQARDYAVVGCVEPCSNGRHYGHSGALLLNLTSALELTLFNGSHRHTGLTQLVSKRTGDPRRFETFDELKKAFGAQVEWLAEQAVRVNNALGLAHQACYPTPILSALFEGPMAAGKDLIEGGATINSSGATIIGLADVADCLSAIEDAVFTKKETSFETLLAAMAADFDGHEDLRARLANPARTPKFGNDEPAADRNARWIVKTLHAILGRAVNYRGGRYRVGYWTMTNHAGFGKLMKAMPNGRHAGKNFASGITPVSGATPSLTKALRSVSSIPAEHLTSGVALNLKYTPELEGDRAREEMIARFAATVKAYFDGPGGLEIQFNIETGDAFRDAMKHPEKHPELLVRVSGYTAYFKDLNPQMQQEIVERSEYRLSAGQAVGARTISLAGKEGAP